MKKLRKDRIMFVCMALFFIILLIIYMIMNMGKEYEYTGSIDTYVCTYEQDDKIYAFDLKSFKLDDQRYVSLNDIYNIMLVLDKKAQVYINQNKHQMVYQLSHQTYIFDYHKDRISFDDQYIDVSKYASHIYTSHKNVYINISFVEKLLLNNKKSIKFKNKNAIILKNE